MKLLRKIRDIYDDWTFAIVVDRAELRGMRTRLAMLEARAASNGKSLDSENLLVRQLYELAAEFGRLSVDVESLSEEVKRIKRSDHRDRLGAADAAGKLQKLEKDLAELRRAVESSRKVYMFGREIEVKA